MKSHILLLIVVSLALAACGGGYNPTGSTSTSNPITYTIGGTVTNLAGMGGGLQLQDNGTNALLVNANGTFTFATSLASGSAYNVTIFRQPSSPAQTCAVTKGAGMATANVTSVAVDCGHSEWTWMGGSNTVNQIGTYGTTPSPGDDPGARGDAVSWADTAGNLWLFGGQGFDSTGTVGHGYLNDLWKYSNGEWTWISGSNTNNQKGTYGMPTPGNVPGARGDAVSWAYTAENLWLFGGQGFDSTGAFADLNDLWKYSNGDWTWRGGSNTINQKGTYGTPEIPSPANVPGARDLAMSWIDTAGNLWLFGGQGFDSTATGPGELNDLWKYSNGEWTWMGGSNTLNQKGTYGTPEIPSPANVPGARYRAVTWIDSAGNLWLFGGQGFDSTGGS